MKLGTLRLGKAGAAYGAVVAGLWLAPIVAGAQDVKVDYDEQADFSRCATYAWAEGQPAPNPLVDRRIVDAIDGALASRGWRKASGASGCFIRYRASAKEQRSLQVWQSGGRWLGGVGSVDVRTVVSGMLVVDIADASGRLIWRGVARDSVSDKPEKNRKKLAKCVEKMFKDLPSASAKS